MLGCWLKTGNLNEISDAHGNRKVVFENTSAQQVIHALTIIRLTSGTFEITAQAKDNAAYTLLIQATLEEGFHGKSLDGFKLLLVTSRLGLIGIYLKVLCKIEPEYGYIKNDVRDSVNVVFNLPQVSFAEIVLQNAPVQILSSYNNFTHPFLNNEGEQGQEKQRNSDSCHVNSKHESNAKKRK